MSAEKVLKIGLIGDHIGQSRFSAAMNILCELHSLTLDFTPIDTGEIDGFDFDAKVDEIIADGWTGVTITHPYKVAARKRAAEGMSANVSHLTSCNILKFRAEVVGFNTDYTGFLGAWRANMGETRPGRVAVAGAGGVAGALVPALVSLGAEDIAIWDPVFERAKQMAERAGGPVRAIDLESANSAILAADGLVNASALGMGGNRRSAFPAETLGSQTWAFDAVYTPTDTPFLVAANAAGLKVISGFDLFRHMILGSFEAYTGVSPDPSVAWSKIDELRPA